MDRSEKKRFVEEFREVLGDAELAVVVAPQGLSVSEAEELRGKVREEAAAYKVAKNTLLRLVVQGTEFEGLTPLLKGQTALAYSKDVPAAAKAVVNFAKTNKKVDVLGGVLGGKFLDAGAVKALAALPSLDELRATLIGLVQAPATKIARVVAEPGASLARVTLAHSKAAA